MKHSLITKTFFAAYFAFTMTAVAAAGESSGIVLDVRTPEEFNESHVKDSRNIDFLAPDFSKQISKLDKTKNYKLYCRSGNRSAKAMEIMKAQGFKNLENLGSLNEAAVKLKQKCEGPKPC